jgi:hypothetical protein
MTVKETLNAVDLDIFFKCNECVIFDVLGLEAEKTANNRINWKP